MCEMCATLSLCLLLNVRDCYLNTPSPLPLFTTGQTDRQPHTFTTYLKTNLLFCFVLFFLFPIASFLGKYYIFNCESPDLLYFSSVFNTVCYSFVTPLFSVFLSPISNLLL